MDTYNGLEHLAHQKRRVGARTPRDVLSWVRGRVLSARQLDQAFRETLWQRTTNRAGYVVVQNYYLYAERALQRQPVCLWFWEDALQIEHQEELLASYPCAYDPAEHAIRRVGEATLHDNRFARQQPQLLHLAPEQWQRVSQRAMTNRQRITRDRTQLRLPGLAVRK